MSAEILQFVRVDDAPNRLRELRMAAKLSQQALGDAIGVSKVTISDLERGNLRLDTGYMRRIAPILGVLPADLLSLEDNPWALSAEERELIHRMRAADDAQREQLHKVADVLVPFKHDTGSGGLKQAG